MSATHSQPEGTRHLPIRRWSRCGIHALLATVFALIWLAPASPDARADDAPPGFPLVGDCNGDGQSDAQAIVDQEMLDSNDNGVLDACEVALGDLDLNEQIDLSDIAIAMLDFGQTEDAPSDLNHDGSVDFMDIALILLEYGPSPHASVPRSMVRDLLAGQSHLDIIVIGDSNATFSAGGSRGFAGGFVDELTRRGVPSYGTGLFPAACSGRDVAYPVMGTRGFATSSQASISVNDSRRDCDGWKPGAASGIELPGLFERSRHAPLQLEGRDIDWAYLPEGTIVNDHSRDWISLGSRGGAAGFGSECAGAYRMVIARMQASDPTSERTPLRLRVTRDFAYGESEVPDVAASVEHLGVPESAVHEVRYAADAGRRRVFATYGVDDSTTGPVGLLLRSMYRTDGVPGFAVTILQNWSGGTSTNIADSLSDGTGCGLSTLRTYLQELRSRQCAAGGTGRVLVWMNMGVNNPQRALAPVHCPLDANRIINQLDRAWRSLGYPPSDLGFIVTASPDGGVSHYEPEATTQALRRAMLGDPRIAVVDMHALVPGSLLSDRQLYAGQTDRPNPHLASDGYRTMIERLLERLQWGLDYQPN
jgi:hypothetical protein